MCVAVIPQTVMAPFPDSNTLEERALEIEQSAGVRDTSCCTAECKDKRSEQIERDQKGTRQVLSVNQKVVHDASHGACTILPVYSARRAPTGLIEAARLAGRQVPAMASRGRMAPAATRVSGS